ncbi:Uncharacterised protein [Mycobacteroides abscessus subsp. abscessus]|nr:Uncharacterised protein [Mycobacteroides abscessus subsp. abscessus]
MKYCGTRVLVCALWAMSRMSALQPQHAQHHPCRAKGDRRGTSDPSCVSSHINAAAPKASLALSQLIMTVSYIDASVSLSVNV